MNIRRICFLDASTFGDSFDFSALEAVVPTSIYPFTDPADVSDRIKGCDVVISNKVRLDREILLLAKDLKLICVAATGTNNVDLVAAKELGIKVSNAVAYSVESVAQHTLALALELIHRNSLRDQWTRDQWANQKVFCEVGRDFFELKDKQWGIIGLGGIGSRVAEMASAFGCKIAYFSASGRQYDGPYTPLDLEELASTSHVISVHCSLRDQTRHLLGHSFFELLMDQVVFMNLARGEVCEPGALLNWVKKGAYKGVGLDVLEQEPPDSSHPLLGVEHSGLIITPHMAWTSVESRNRLLNDMVQNIREFQSGGHRNPVWPA